jgi:hypothetical protein
MEITSDSLPWDSDDIAVWQTFLNSRTGQRLIPKILESTPELLGSADTNAILIRSGEVRGFQEFARTMLSLSTYPKQVISEPATNYPSLTDDRSWNDGNKIQP